MLQSPLGYRLSVQPRSLKSHLTCASARRLLGAPLRSPWSVPVRTDIAFGDRQTSLSVAVPVDFIGRTLAGLQPFDREDRVQRPCTAQMNVEMKPARPIMAGSMAADVNSVSCPQSAFILLSSPVSKANVIYNL